MKNQVDKKAVLGPSSESEATGTLGIARQIPQFWYDEPQLWFAMIEAYFNENRIKSEESKYEHMLSFLDKRLARKVEDIIINPPPVDPYTKLKTKVIRRQSLSEDKKIRRFLQHEELGEHEPSQFLRHLESLAGTTIDQVFLKTLWLQKLLTFTQQVLKAHQSMSVEDLAAIADSIEVTSAPVGPRLNNLQTTLHYCHNVLRTSRKL
ncbi:uncharacterized protein LOC113375794 [Ctenocephalides felis]|uniref:uncharacterized protein LOC113375794 n=1 Tax=Ctenocephalides felis TaxID=7515 RepID=UPI000E6E36F6|nr:uncharacterized protein LOC113375794 [Ctenocephalides felis]